MQNLTLSRFGIRRTFVFFPFAASIVSGLFLWCGEVHGQTGTVLGPKTAIVTTNRVIESQSRRTFSFAKAGVLISNDFDGARLDNVEMTGTNSFSATVSPENFPINESAWYAFKIWSKSNQTVFIKLIYKKGSHRYQPKISSDGTVWKKLESKYCAIENNGESATLELQIGAKPIYVAGQELFTGTNFESWMAELCQKPFVHSEIIGYSVLGKPIQRLIISEAKAPEYFLVLSRQHPPEVTGTFALKSFLDTIMAETELAKSFRKRFSVVVVPLANPDGVAAGNWRHNANGVDLNRDWGQFNQPETRVLRDEFLRVQKDSNGKVRMGLDFHSTQHDVFYTNESSETGKQYFVKRWLAEIQSAVPDYKVKIEPSKNKVEGATLTSIAWMNHQFNIPAVTYEVGDDTDRKLIDHVASVGATTLMKLLLENRVSQAVGGN